MNVIVGLGAFGMSMFLFYRACTYESHSPGRWGVTRRAKVVSRFSLVMQGQLALLFSVVVSFESIEFAFRLMFGLLGFAGVFAGMIYDQYIRKEELDDADRSQARSDDIPLSVGITRVLGESILVASVIGSGVGYVLGAVEALGNISPGLLSLQVYIFAMAIPWVATMVTLGSAPGRNFALGDAPLWSRAVPCVGVLLGVSALLSVPFLGDTLQVGSWADAASWTRAAFFFSVAPMWFMPVPVAMVIRRRAAMTEPVQLG